MKIKKLASFSNDRQIWRLLISEYDKLIIEERDVEKKEAFFSCMDISSGKTLWKNFQLDEKYWVGIEALYKDVIVFHKYGRPDMPRHREIIAYNLNDKNLLWNTLEYQFLFAFEDKIYCFQEGFEKHKYAALNYLTGVIEDDLGSDAALVNEKKYLAGQEDEFADYLYAEDYQTAQELSEAAKGTIDRQISDFNVSGKIEFIQYDDYILFNFYHKNERGTLTNRFFAFDYTKNKKVVDEVLITSANAFVPDSFFMKKQFLFLLKEKTAVSIYNFK